MKCYYFVYWTIDFYREITLIVKRPTTISEMRTIAKKLEHDAA